MSLYVAKCWKILIKPYPKIPFSHDIPDFILTLISILILCYYGTSVILLPDLRILCNSLNRLKRLLSGQTYGLQFTSFQLLKQWFSDELLLYLYSNCWNKRPLPPPPPPPPPHTHTYPARPHTHTKGMLHGCSVGKGYWIKQTFIHQRRNSFGKLSVDVISFWMMNVWVFIKETTVDLVTMIAFIPKHVAV